MYYLTYINGTKLEGGTLHNSNWKNLPSNDIVSLECHIFNEPIILTGYDKYNYRIEWIYLLTGKKQKSLIISKVFLEGLKDTTLDRYVIDFKSKKLYKEKIENFDYSKISGWKNGISKETII